MGFLEILREFKGTLLARLVSSGYHLTLSNLRKKRDKKTIVGFFVSEISKWKGQPLYDILTKDDAFDPIILVYPTIDEVKYDDSKLLITLVEKACYFESRGMKVKRVWDATKHRCLSLHDINCDILFYQQPWDYSLLPGLFATAFHSLTFYFPYYLVNNFYPEIEINTYLHRYIFRYILLNDYQVSLYDNLISSRLYAGEMVGLGHPFLDALSCGRSIQNNRDYIIYAPHFSIPVGGKSRILNYSTFLDFGLFVLDFAINNPQYKWVFKPHPRLRNELVQSGVWTIQKVDAYYSQWEKIGTVCYSSDYLDYFFNSRVLITDCGSFLTEFSCTNRPIIRLIPQSDVIPPNPALKGLFSTFYEARNTEELLDLFEMIIYRGEDPNKEERTKCLTDIHLIDTSSSEKIVSYIKGLLNK